MAKKYLNYLNERADYVLSVRSLYLAHQVVGQVITACHLHVITKEEALEIIDRMINGGINHYVGR